nr:zinc finger protein 91-like isoform X1 [Leptinotarsa decemlineata]
MDIGEEYPKVLTNVTCKTEPENDSNLIFFQSNLEDEPSEGNVETLIIEVVEDEDYSQTSSHTISEPNITSKHNLIGPSFIKNEPPGEITPGYVTARVEFPDSCSVKHETDDESISKVKTDRYINHRSLWSMNSYEWVCDQFDPNKAEILSIPMKIENGSSKEMLDDPNYYPTSVCNNVSESEETPISKVRQKTRPEKCFLCEICRKSFSKSFNLRRHLQAHLLKQSQQPFSCKICGKRFTRLKNLRLHLKNSHVEERFETRSEEYQCYHCEKVYRKRRLLVIHMQIHRKKVYQCGSCTKSFRLEKSLMWHRTVHLEKEFRCPLCEDVFLSLRNLRRHRFQFHLFQKYKCKHCPKTFESQSGFVKHVKRHSLEKILQLAVSKPERWSKTCKRYRISNKGDLFLCEVCGSVFRSLKFFERHKQSHKKQCQCEFCGRLFGHMETLHHHSQFHTESAKFQCEICGKSFLMMRQFLRHRKIHAQEPSSFLCETCGRSFNTKDGFSKHRRIHRKKAYECLVCGMNFSLVEYYDDHMKRHKKRPFKCTVCPLDFTQDKHLKSHMQTHEKKRILDLQKDNWRDVPCGTTEKEKRSQPLVSSKENLGHRCKICLKTFPFRSVLINHEKCHSNNKSFKCPICFKFLKTNLERHMKVHSEERPFECSVCKKRFRIRDQMYKHMKIHAVDPTFVCSICSKGFFSSFALALHRKVHAGNEEYQCNVCEKKFYQMSLLEEHLRQHTGEKPFQCEFCEKRFRIKAFYTRHQKKNPEKKLFHCSICSKRFCVERDLNGHLKDHVGSNCPVCKKVFSNLYDLQVHTKMHWGKNKIECDICKETFTLKSSLKRHALLHTGERPFKCNLCSKSFQRNSHLKGHIEMIHRRKMVSGKSGASNEKSHDDDKHKSITDGESPEKKKVIIRVISKKRIREL